MATRIGYAEYCKQLREGKARNYQHTKYCEYGSSGIATLRKLGLRIDGAYLLNKENFENDPQSWREVAEEMREFLGL